MQIARLSRDVLSNNNMHPHALCACLPACLHSSYLAVPLLQSSPAPGWLDRGSKLTTQAHSRPCDSRLPLTLTSKVTSSHAVREYILGGVAMGSSLRSGMAAPLSPKSLCLVSPITFVGSTKPWSSPHHLPVSSPHSTSRSSFSSADLLSPHTSILPFP
jgi:hypothetical protein